MSKDCTLSLWMNGPATICILIISGRMSGLDLRIPPKENYWEI